MGRRPPSIFPFCRWWVFVLLKQTLPLSPSQYIYLAGCWVLQPAVTFPLGGPPNLGAPSPGPNLIPVGRGFMPAPLTASSCPTSGPAPQGPRQGWGCGARRECPVSSRAYPARRHFTAWPRREFIEQVPACQTAVSRCPATASAGGTGSQNNLSCSLERPLGAFVLKTQPGGEIAVATVRNSGGRGVPTGELQPPRGCSHQAGLCDGALPSVVPPESRSGPGPRGASAQPACALWPGLWCLSPRQGQGEGTPGLPREGQ